MRNKIEKIEGDNLGLLDEMINHFYSDAFTNLIDCFLDNSNDGEGCEPLSSELLDWIEDRIEAQGYNPHQ